MTQEQMQYLQHAEAEVESQEGFIQMLDASNRKNKEYLSKLREAYAEIELLKQRPTINVSGDYVENKTVGKQISYSPSASTNSCQKKDPTLLLKEIM